MSREVRMVKPGWEHPKGQNPWGYDYIPMFGPNLYEKEVAEWEAEKAAWDRGEVRDYSRSGMAFKPKDGDEGDSFSEWHGERPKREHYMPEWSPQETTQLMMYETTSEGTPISPAFDTPEELARWLADTNASAFGNNGASYEEWLIICYGGWAPSAMIQQDGRLVSGVSGMAQTYNDRVAAKPKRLT